MVTKYNVNYDYLEIIDTPEKAQILGLLFADGCVVEKQNTVKVSLIEDDRAYLETINELFSSDRMIYCDNRGGKRFYKEHKKYYDIKNSLTLAFHNKKLVDDCMRWGVVPRKTYIDCEFPDIPDHLVNSFILGLFEGDGCLSINSTPSKVTEKRYQAFGLTLLLQEKFAKKVLEVLDKELGLTCKYRLHQNCSNNLYRICIKRISYLTKLYHYLYKDTSFVMKRKHDKFLKLMEIFRNKGYETGEIFEFNK